MSNYIKSTDFAVKDGLLTGNPLKIVSGTEINDEFNAIQTAVGTKANTLSPTLTGVPLAPTAPLGTNTTQLSTTAFVTTAGNLKADLASPALTGTPTSTTAAVGTNSVQIATTAFVQGQFTKANINGHTYPVGSIYTAVVSTNPATLLGVGTWVAFGEGRVLISADGTYPVESTGGASTHTLTVEELPSHSHTTAIRDTTQGVGGGSGAGTPGTLTTRTSSAVGGGTAHNIMQPYISVYMWKRTA
tara:strand:+ start:12735 stop:13469 length:735 start_codon:yes stop_codon:yes gene_type:complete